MKFVWQDIISTLSALWKTLCGIHGPHFDVSNVVILTIFESVVSMAHILT
jgi:hypothetical protein